MAYKYLILDSRGNAVAHGTSEYSPQGPPVADGHRRRRSGGGGKAHLLRLVGNSDAVPAMEGRIVRGRAT